jgi:hypothetical protein
VYEYDPATKKIRTILDIQKVLNLPDGHYVPGKIHTKLGMGADGWIYCATHRGSPRTTTDEYHYKGDWILRANPETGEAEVVTFAPVPSHAIPTGALDPQRLIFYGGTAAGVYVCWALVPSTRFEGIAPQATALPLIFAVFAMATLYMSPFWHADSMEAEARASCVISAPASMLIAHPEAGW